MDGVPVPRVTELANPLTTHLDVAHPAEFVRILGGSDAQLFVGFGGLPGLFSDDVVSAGVRAAHAVARALQHPCGRVVFAGCGTSGRLAHYLAAAFNDWMRRCRPSEASARFSYLLAGGDAALVVPAENIEDDPVQARADLDSWEARESASAERGLRAPVVLFGISCGLSATYVGALLEAALDRSAPGTQRAYYAVAVGFNPVAAVANVRVARWLPSSFHGVLQVCG
jgi:N-acetylmuramic acid 6-phosphate (MurNAc-6-P) etherase